MQCASRVDARFAMGALLAAWLLAPPPNVFASGSAGSGPMPEIAAASLLLTYYESLVKDQDVAAFERAVLARYPEGALARLVRIGPAETRQAAVLALGLTGSFQSNATVGRCLRDKDPAVRSLAQSALWSIWFRAGTPENNATLERVRELIGLERYREARELATHLIASAPDFAEAYNQRAIAYYSEQRYAESAKDCERALERNAYHIGALGGLGQCYLRMGRREEALNVYQRALKLQPFSDGLRETVAELQAGGV